MKLIRFLKIVGGQQTRIGIETFFNLGVKKCSAISLFVVPDTFKEIVHGVGRYPDVVKVRTKLLGGPCNTWYSDAQGETFVGWSLIRAPGNVRKNNFNRHYLRYFFT